MAGSDTIREFLVALGFKVDETGMRKFEDGIKRATKAVVLFATEVEATALTVAYGIDRWASGLEKLYFASQRTGASVTYLKALDRASQDLGASAGEMVGAMEHLASWLRASPANEQILASVIGPLKYLKNGLVDTEDAMKRLHTGFRNLVNVAGGRQFYAQLRAGQMGFTDKQLQILLDPSFNEKVDKSIHELRNVDWDKAAQDAHKFESGMRDIWTILESLGVQIEETLLKKLGVNFRDVGNWLQTHGPEIAKTVADAIYSIIEAAKWLIDKLVALDRATDGWSTKLLALAALLKVTGAGSLLFGIGQMASAIGAVGIAASAATAAIVGLLAISGVWADRQYHSPEYAAEREKALKMPHGGSGATWGGAISGSMSNRQGAINFLQGLGYTNEQVAGIVGNLMAESQLNPDASNKLGNYGIAQWDGKRQALFKKKFGHDIHGSGIDEQLMFLAWELQNSERYANSMLMRAGTPVESANAFGQYFERYDPVGSNTKERERREGLANNVYQTLNFTISDAKDPQSTADKIMQHLAEANAKLYRNVTPNTQ